jgi:hypothetical protein
MKARECVLNRTLEPMQMVSYALALPTTRQMPSASSTSTPNRRLATGGDRDSLSSDAQSFEAVVAD